jgi:hypothetical protein
VPRLQRLPQLAGPVSEDKARTEATRLKGILEKHGVKVSIELRIGRPNIDGSDWWTRKHVSMNHHTAGPAAGLTPTLSLVKNGRSDLPGPLANGYGGRDHVYRIITMGLANHPGLGGPLTVAGFTVPKDAARASCWGTEWEHTGVDPWPADMRDFMARSNAALLEWMDRPVEASIEHKTWAPDRKIDRNTYTAEKGQDEVRAYLASLEDDMTPAEMWTELASHDAWFVDKSRRAVQDELGDENIGAFSDRIVQKVLAALPAQGGCNCDPDVIAAKVAINLAARLAS